MGQQYVEGKPVELQGASENPTLACVGSVTISGSFIKGQLEGAASERSSPHFYFCIVPLTSLQCSYINGRQVDGHFEQDLLNGRGVVQYEDGSCYTGQFRDGLRHGQGYMTWPDGDTFKGAYDQDVKHGKGRYTWHDGCVSQALGGGCLADRARVQANIRWHVCTRVSGWRWHIYLANRHTVRGSQDSRRKTSRRHADMRLQIRRSFYSRSAVWPRHTRLPWRRHRCRHVEVQQAHAAAVSLWRSEVRKCRPVDTGRNSWTQ